MTTFVKNETDVCDRAYTVILSHDQIRSLMEWIPKNYESEGHEEGGLIMTALKEAQEMEDP